MKRRLPYLFILTMSLAIAAAPVLAIRVGQPAPDFTGTASNGQTYKLSDFRG